MSLMRLTGIQLLIKAALAWLLLACCMDPPSQKRDKVKGSLFAGAATACQS